jgi:putative DNA primase/helicase
MTDEPIRGQVIPLRAGTDPVDDFEANRRPIIRIEDGQFDRVVDEVERALAEPGQGVYQRNGRLAVVGPVKRKTAKKDEEVEVSAIRQCEPDFLHRLICKAARYQKPKARGGVKDCDPPFQIAKTLAGQSMGLQLPVLRGVINAPTILQDGTLLTEPGYNAASGLLFQPGNVKFPAIPSHVTKEMAAEALGVLKELISTFPFVAGVDRSVMLSGILTALVRNSLRLAPLHGFSSPNFGTGKSLLVDSTHMIAFGRKAGVTATGDTQAEFEKRIGAALLQGEQCLAIDNALRPIGGEQLSQIITQESVRPRILGKSRSPECDTNIFVTATGINLKGTEDMTRRMLISQIDANMDNPHKRSFPEYPLDIIEQSRGKYVIAALTALKGYFDAGKPNDLKTDYAFPDWSAMVRAPLVWLGEADPALSMDEVKSEDPARILQENVMGQWHKAMGSAPVMVKEVIGRAAERTISTAPDGTVITGDLIHPEFHSVLMDIAGNGSGIDSRRLGTWISGLERTAVGNKRFIRGKKIDGYLRWKLQIAGDHGLFLAFDPDERK